MRLDVEVSGEHAVEEVRSLRHWLIANLQLQRVKVLELPQEARHPGGERNPLRIVMEAPQDLLVVFNALTAWLGVRGKQLALTITVTAADEVAKIEFSYPDDGRAFEQIVALAGPVESYQLAELGAEAHDAYSINRMTLFNHDPANGGSLDLARAFDGLDVQGDRVPPVSDASSSEVSALPITIYLSDEGAHEQVQAAVEDLLGVVGLDITGRDEPILGSWFRRMWAGVTRAVRSPAAREAGLVATHVVDTRLHLAQDAAISAALMQNLGPVIASLESTPEAVIRLGSVVIVKVDGVVMVDQLTAAQQAVLDHRPKLVMSPHELSTLLKAKQAANGVEKPAIDQPFAISPDGSAE